MSDEIKQVFGLDVSAAIKGLEQLDSAFAKTFSSLSNNNNFQTFNSNAANTIGVLRQMRDAARDAAIELAKVGKLNAGGGGGGGGGGGAGGGARRAPQPKLLTGEAAGDALGALLGDPEAQARNAARAAQQTGSAFQQASTGVNNFAISFETLTRVLATQLIVRALSQIRAAVEDSVSGFIQFDRAIAEIATIATDESFSQLAGQVRQLSDQFNAPLLDVAKAKYEALSNGFETAESSTQLLTAALKFSKVGIASTAESLDLLSTALNAYGNSAGHAETLAAKLFETIRVGRVIGSELANSFGRVAPFGKQVGASEDELLAAFSSITIGGVKANEAATQIRATISSLLKPSEAMKEALRSLGFESGEQIIGAKGFQGALLALKGTTDGSASAMAKLFPNVRAIGGVFRETTTGLDIYQQHLEAIRKSSAEILNTKFEDFVKRDSQQVSNNLNQLKNFFTVDLGSQLTGKLGSAFKVVGVDTLINAMKEFIPLAITATGALTGLAAAATLGSFANKALSVSFYTLQADGTKAFTALSVASASFKVAMLGVTSLLASYGVGRFIGQQLLDSIEAPIKELEKAQAQLRNFQQQQRDATNNLENIKTEEQGRAINDRLAKVRKSVFDEVDAAKEGNSQILKTAEDTLQRLIGVRAKYATDLQRAATTSQNDVVASKKREVDTLQALDDARFDFSITRLRSFAKRQSDFYLDSERQRNRAFSISQEAANKLAVANTPDEKEAALNGFKRAESYAKAAVESARSARNMQAEEDAANALFVILRQKAQAEEKYQATRKAAAQQEEQAAARERERVDNLNRLSKTFLKASSLFDDKGNPLDPKTIEENKGKAKAAIAEIRNLLFTKDSKFDFKDLLSFDKLQKQFDQNVTKKEIDVLFKETPGNLASLYARMQGDVKKFGPILIDFAVDPKKLLGKTLKDQVAEVEAQAKERSARIPELRQADSDRTNIQTAIQQQIDKAAQEFKQEKSVAEKIFDSVFGPSSRPTKFTPEAAFQQQIQKEYEEIGKQIEQQVANAQTKGVGGLREEQLAALQNRLSNAINNDKGVEFGQEANRRERVLESLRESIRLKEKEAAINAKYPNLDKELERNNAQQTQQGGQAIQFNSQYQRYLEQQELLKQEAARANQGASLSPPPTGALDSAVQRANEYADALERAARAAQAAVPPIGALAGSAYEGVQYTSYTGGQVPEYFANGGFNRGIDTINAKLAPREVVMNQQASSRFFSQLTAMNAGVHPQATRSTSGDTFQVGDINIHEAGNAKDTARQVLNAIYRQQRRGSGRSLK